MYKSNRKSKLYMTAEVIKFPVKNKRISDRPEPLTLTKEVIGDSVGSMKELHVQETLDAISPMIFERIHAAGFNFSEYQNPEDIKYGALVMEALESLLNKYYGLYHPFQTVAEDIFKVLPNQDLDIVDELHIKFVDKADVEVNMANTA